MQTQILGISSGITVTDENCERIKLARSLYASGMKVASVSILCQDPRVWDSMTMAGTPCHTWVLLVKMQKQVGKKIWI